MHPHRDAMFFGCNPSAKVLCYGLVFTIISDADLSNAQFLWSKFTWLIQLYCATFTKSSLGTPKTY